MFTPLINVVDKIRKDTSLTFANALVDANTKAIEMLSSSPRTKFKLVTNVDSLFSDHMAEGRLPIMFTDGNRKFDYKWGFATVDQMIECTEIWNLVPDPNSAHVWLTRAKTKHSVHIHPVSELYLYAYVLSVIKALNTASTTNNVVDTKWDKLTYCILMSARALLNGLTYTKIEDVTTITAELISDQYDALKAATKPSHTFCENILAVIQSTVIASIQYRYHDISVMILCVMCCIICSLITRLYSTQPTQPATIEVLTGCISISSG